MPLVIAGTGHRPSKLKNEWRHVGPISNSILLTVRNFLLQHKPDSVISGMALGFDMLWAQTAIELGIPVLAAIPFRGQELTWQKESQEAYWSILENKLVKQWIVTPGGFNVFKLLERNRAMVQKCDMLLACWDGSFGGTRDCILCGKESGKPVYRFRPGSDVIERLFTSGRF